VQERDGSPDINDGVAISMCSAVWAEANKHRNTQQMVIVLNTLRNGYNA
jgi:hypothetical protein